MDRGPDDLADDLVRRGLLRDPAWVEAFRNVPRRALVPYFLERRDGIVQRIEDVERIYSDDVLMVQFSEQGAPTSSSSMPSLMASMLEALDLTGAERVLEIGTGPGWNAGLLAYRLGDERVVSVDIDGELVETARERLRGLGLRPTLVAGDGAEGHAPGGPYDRIISTCAWPRVPEAWLRQTRDGGMIMLNLHRGLFWGGVLRLRVAGGHADGTFLPGYGGFLPTRTGLPTRDLPAWTGLPTWTGLAARTGLPGGWKALPRLDTGERRIPEADREILDGPLGFRLAAALSVDAVRIWRASPAGPRVAWLLAPDGSWACLFPDVVFEGGPAKLWREIEAVHREWEALGRPGMEACGLTVTAGGEHIPRLGPITRDPWRR